MGVRLPAEYQEVEYLQTDGNQRIRTNAYINSNNIDVECKIAMMNGLKTMTRPILLAHGGGGNYFIPLGLLESSDHYQYFSSADGEREEWANIYNASYNEPLTIRTVFDSVAHKRAAFVNGLKTEESSYNSDLVSGIGEKCNLWLFTWMTSPNVANTRSRVICKFYHLRYREDDVEKLDLIPCYRKSDSKPGMYDLVTKQFFTNAGTGEFTVGPDVIDSISPLMVAWRRIMMAAASRLIKRIATGVNGVVNFVTKVKKPTKVVCEFSPVQEGTGDPSPDNVRPISGWTGCEITHTGENLLSPDDTGYGNYTIGPTGNHTTGSYARLSSGFIPVSKGDVLTLGTWITLYKNVGFGFAGIAIYDKDKQFVRRESKNNTWSITVTIGEGEKYIRAFSQFEPESESAILTPSVWSRYKIQLERASSRTTYKSYTGSTLPITFTDPSTGDPLTVYGGTVTLNEDGSGELAVEWEKQSFSSSQGFSVYGSNENVTVFRKKSTTSKTPTTEQISNIAVYDKNAFATSGNPNVFQVGSTGNLFLKLSASEASTTTDLDTLLSGTPLDVVFKVEIPTTYNLTAEQVNSLIGTNNIWHNMNGDITVEYWNKQ